MEQREAAVTARAAGRRTTRLTDYAWRCQECGHKFRNAAAAERAAFGDRGCPKCGSSPAYRGIDYSLPVAA